MSPNDLWERVQSSLVEFSAVGVASGLFWLVRRILTNQKQIELLKQSLQNSQEHRARDREDLLEVKQYVKELRAEIQQIFRREGS